MGKVANKMTKKPYFEPVGPKVSFPELEEKVLSYWKKEKIFEKSLQNRSKNKSWNFLDGPPFVTGTPHYGTLLSSLPKDLFGRYWTMKGYHVRRVWGWDGHGLPIENKVEKKLGIKHKREIEERVGVEKFIKECLYYVNKISSEWEWYVDHIGRWADFKNSYKTWDKDYMESVMWVFKTMYDRGFIYKGLRVSLYCPHCQTPISNFEVAMDSGENYKDITDSATTYKYELKDEKNTFLLAWSTTPWNKIATPALAVNPNLTYIKVSQGNEKYILAEATSGLLLKKPKHKVLEKFSGKKLLGKKFVPHYDYYKVEKGKRAFVVIGGDFVTAEEGSGIVTLAVYGEDDLEVMKKENIQFVMHVNDDGILRKEVPKWAGMHYLKVNKLVDKDLDKRGLVYKKEKHSHKIAHCWRCGTQLFHNPQNAWFVDVGKLKPTMKMTNKNINWFPKHFKYGRFLKSMESAPDWCISRNRYWGSPVPVWECECGERFVPGSIKELEKESGKKVSDLHKPKIDKVTVVCRKCGKTSKRVSEVLDSWIEAGSASFAERHFPFAKNINLDKFFPPDFVAEYTGQIRAWFYVIHVISAALYKSHGFKNVVVSGVILGTDGRKMSKNYGNFPDPEKMLKTYGGDALRLYLLGSPVMKGEDIIISEEDYRNKVRGFLIPLWNVYNFFITYANLHKWSHTNITNFKPRHILDRWILSRMNGGMKNMYESGYEVFNTQEVVDLAWIFVVRDLSGWYVRRSRERFAENDKSAFETLWRVLTTYMKALAPLAPFISEHLYLNLTNGESVHLEDLPEVAKKFIDPKLELEMEDIVRKASEQTHSIRKNLNIPVRRPLVSVASTLPEPKIPGAVEVVKDEVNALDIVWKAKRAEIDTTQTPQTRKMEEKRLIIRKIQNERRKIGAELNQFVNVMLPSWPKIYEAEIIKRTLTKKLQKGTFKVKKA